MIPIRQTTAWLAGLLLCLVAAHPTRGEMLLGLEVSNPGLTARYARGNLQLEVNAGFHVRGFKSRAGRSGTAGLDEWDALARYRLVPLGEHIGLNIFGGTSLDHHLVAGAGFGFRMPVSGRLHAYMDADLAYFASSAHFDRFSWSGFSSDRLHFGFLKSF